MSGARRLIQIPLPEPAAFISVDPDRRVHRKTCPVPDAMLSSLTACSSLGFATYCRLKSGLKLGETDRRGAGAPM